MSQLKRVQTMKILGVTVTNGLSFSLHVQAVITSCAQTLYALRVLRAHGLCGSALKTIFRAVVVAKLLYASSAWWGFASAADRQKIKAFIGQCTRAGFCASDLGDCEALYTSADRQLFDKVLYRSDHLLYQFLPPIIFQNYSLEDRVHHR